MIDFESDRVSAAVVIPAFNAAATIVETLRALQVCPGVAKLGGVFVCDDASTDDTLRLAADAWTAIPKLTILRNEERLGERRTVNAAFKRVRGDYEWIFILHADDVVKETGWLSILNESRPQGLALRAVVPATTVGTPKQGRSNPAKMISRVSGTRLLAAPCSGVFVISVRGAPRKRRPKI